MSKLTIPNNFDIENLRVLAELTEDSELGEQVLKLLDGSKIDDSEVSCQPITESIKKTRERGEDRWKAVNDLALSKTVLSSIKKNTQLP